MVINMNVLQKTVNDVILANYNVDNNVKEFVEVFNINDKTHISFMSKQHAEEFMEYHGDFLDENIIIKVKNLKVEDIEYKYKEELEEDEVENVVYENAEYQPQLEEYESVKNYIAETIELIQNEANQYEKFSDNWFEELEKLAPLVKVYNTINKEI